MIVKSKNYARGKVSVPSLSTLRSRVCLIGSLPDFMAEFERSRAQLGETQLFLRRREQHVDNGPAFHSTIFFEHRLLLGQAHIFHAHASAAP